MLFSPFKDTCNASSRLVWTVQKSPLLVCFQSVKVNVVGKQGVFIFVFLSLFAVCQNW